MDEYVPLIEGDMGGGGSASRELWHLEDKEMLQREQLELLAQIAAPLRNPQDNGPEVVSGYCLCQNRFDRWKRYYCVLNGTQLSIKTLRKGTGETGKLKTTMDVRFVTFGPIALSEKEAITAAGLSTDCPERFRIFSSHRTRIVVPASKSDFERWSSALHSLLENHLDAADLERRQELAKGIEPIYTRHTEYMQKKGALMLHALGNVGILENEKKNAVRQGVMKLQADGDGGWKKTFVLIKPYIATYHESGKSYKKGVINLKLARVEASAKSTRRFKVITPMATYCWKARHDADAKDWISAFQAAAQGNKSYSSLVTQDELDVQNFTGVISKPYIVVKGRTYKLSESKAATVGRSSACTVVVDDSKVSREHLKIEFTSAGKWVVTDMGSQKGTKLNGAKITQHSLKPNDQIIIGNGTVIHFKAK